MTTPNPTRSHSLSSANVDAIRLVANVIPVVKAATPPARGFISALTLLPKMYSDSRYIVSPLGRIGPILGLTIAFLSYVFWTYFLPVPLIAVIAERLILAGVSISIYLMLAHELNRYRKVLDYLEKYG